MATEYMFPDLGEGVTEGEIKKWLVKEGDVIVKDQALAEVETDKAVVEMPSPVAGTVLRMNHREGDLVKVGEVLAVIGEKGEAVPAAKKADSEKLEGTGDPVQEMPLSYRLAYRPACGFATTSSDWFTAIDAGELNEISARIGCGAIVPACDTFARIPEIRRLSLPEGGTVSPMPLKAIDWPLIRPAMISDGAALSWPA